MKNPTVIAGIAFGLGSVSQLVLGNYFAALATGLFASGMLLCDIPFAASLPRAAVGPLLTWRRLISLLLLGASVGLFGYDVGRTLRQATHKSTAQTEVMPAR
jgi:hypothetical protein